jgi:hypothetical protein
MVEAVSQDVVSSQYGIVVRAPPLDAKFDVGVGVPNVRMTLPASPETTEGRRVPHAEAERRN